MINVPLDSPYTPDEGVVTYNGCNLQKSVIFFCMCSVSKSQTFNKCQFTDL